jgi:hypothetical protein
LTHESFSCDFEKPVPKTRTGTTDLDPLAAVTALFSFDAPLPHPRRGDLHAGHQTGLD